MTLTHMMEALDFCSEIYGAEIQPASTICKASWKKTTKRPLQKFWADPCVIYKRDFNGEVWVTIKIDYFLVFGSKLAGMEAFCMKLTSKC